MTRPLPLLALLLLSSGCLGGMQAGAPEEARAPAQTWTAADCSTRIIQFVSEAAPIQERLPPGHEVDPLLDQEAHPMAFNEFQVTACPSLLLGNDTLVRGGAFALLSTSIRSAGPNFTFYALLVCSPSQNLVAAFASMGFEGETCAIEAEPTTTRVRTPDGTILVRHQPTPDGPIGSRRLLRDYCKAPAPGSHEVPLASASLGLDQSVIHVGSVTFDGPFGAAIRPQPAATTYMDDRSGAVALDFRHEPNC